MRYHYEEPIAYVIMGETYRCDHELYSECTLFRDENRGLAVIQQRFNPISKKSWWGKIDECLTMDIYYNKRFRKYFDERAAEPVNYIYPTVSVRQIMWALKMKPLPRERWETVFDRRFV